MPFFRKPNIEKLKAKNNVKGLIKALIGVTHWLPIAVNLSQNSGVSGEKGESGKGKVQIAHQFKEFWQELQEKLK